MQRLKMAIKRSLSSDPFDIIAYGQPSRQDYCLAIHTFHSLSSNKSIQISQALTKRLGKMHSNRYMLCLLVLCDFIAATAPQLLCGNYPYGVLQEYEKKSKMQRKGTKEERIQLGQNNFIYFYMQYLETKAWKTVEICNEEIPQFLKAKNQIQTTLSICQNSIKAIKLIFKYDFVMDFAIKTSQNAYTICLGLQNILRRVSEDMTVCIKFIQKWSYLIITQTTNMDKYDIEQKKQSMAEQQDNNNNESNLYKTDKNKQLSLRTNQIYEQIIYISKNVDKFKILQKKVINKYKQLLKVSNFSQPIEKDNDKRYQLQQIQSFQKIFFPSYAINKQLNQTIQQCMMQRQQQRKQFLLSKRCLTLETTRILQTQESQKPNSIKKITTPPHKKIPNPQYPQSQGMQITQSQIFVNVKL